MKRLLAGLALLLTAAAAPPPTLSSYIHDGRFDPGDYGWIKGAFADAGPADKAAAATFWSWQAGCQAAEAARIKAELVTLGIADPKIAPGPYQDDLCGQVLTTLPDTRAWPSFAAFSADLERARPVVAAVLWTTRIAERVAAESSTEAEALAVRPTGEQILRFAQTWDLGSIQGAPPLTERARAIAVRLLWLGIRERDHANTAWLEELVAHQGWPRRSVVGARAAQRAWLLAQHADDAPVFQLRVLRLMAPLVARHEVTAADYGLLYDRVMLKLRGVQRYGTQMTCTGGAWAPRPLEDADKVAGYRAQAGMPTMAENLARIRAEYGACPAEPTGRAPPNK